MSSSSNGTGFAGLLEIVFITLKLTGFISWSWWWVLSPLWIGLVFLVLFLIGLIIFARAKFTAEPEQILEALYNAFAGQ